LSRNFIVQQIRLGNCQFSNGKQSPDKRTLLLVTQTTA